jgi:AcrR family transcriptional regulator
VANAPRTRLEPSARRAQLVDVGLQMLGARPLEQVAIDDVAAAAGISRGLLFDYFPT